MNQAFIALGTNIGMREEHLNQALSLLNGRTDVEIKRKSSIYETAPVGFVDQADFLNMVIHITTSLSPLKLLDVCQEIEHQLGRERSIRFGPRTIDLDILLYNQENSDTERLVIPHPRMHERAFVLIPLAEIAPEESIPTLNRSVREQLVLLPEAVQADVLLWDGKSE